MLLQDIISGTLKSSHVLILDTAKHRGDKIVDAILARHKSKPIPIHGLCFERACVHQEERLGDQVVTLHDMFSDPLGWLSAKGTAVDVVDVCDYVCSKVERGTKIVLWIDSLSSALLSIDENKLYNQIHRLLKRVDEHGVEVTQLVTCLHADVEQQSTVALVSHLASTCVLVKPPTDKSRLPLYELTHHKPNGKLFKETQLFSVGESGEILSHALEREEKVTVPQPQSTTSKPVHDTFSTFRHGLSTEEQRAREQLVLPFQRLAMGGAARGQGRIEYEPEEADQWDEDEEDPDDDLEV